MDESKVSGHETAFAASRLARHRTQAVVHRLEAALAMAAGGDIWLMHFTTVELGRQAWLTRRSGWTPGAQ